MIRIEKSAWEQMVAHAESAYPEECCGAMLGHSIDGMQHVTRAVRLENITSGPRGSRYEIRPEDLLKTERRAQADGLTSLGIYHSHPDADAYFSETDLRNSCPWYSFVVLAVRKGRFDYARGFRPDPDQTRAEPETVYCPNGETRLWPES